MIVARFLSLLALAAPGLLLAQAAPGAGQLLRETQPKTAPASPEPNAPALEISRPAAPPAASGKATAIAVRTIAITGNTVLPIRALHALVIDGEGASLTLAELQALAARITRAYQNRGYLLARAYLPAQEIKDGVVTIAVQEGRLGQIRINNTSRISNATATSFFNSLKPGEIVTARALEGSLLRLSDTPGVLASSTLTPGTAPDTADLVVTTTAAPLFSGHVNVDNYGGESTGSTRLGGLVSLASPFHLGDQLTLQGLTSLESGQHLRYGRIGYDTLLNGHGTRLGVAYARLDYGLGQNFTALDASGTADVGSVILTHPFIRTRTFTLQALATYDYKVLKDEIAVAGTHNNRDLNIGAIGLNASLRDNLLGGGVTSASLLFSVSHVNFTDTAAKAVDDATARTQGSTGKLTGSLERQQRLGRTTTLRLAVNGQEAGGNLDSSEKFSLGGPDNVRAYPQGEISGDNGYVATAELLQTLPVNHRLGDWQAVAFYDGGQTHINRSPFAAGNNTRSLSGAGVGLRWSWRDRWSARTDAAWRISGGSPTTGGDRTPRIWASLGYAF